MYPKDAEGIANSVDPDQTAHWIWLSLLFKTLTHICLVDSSILINWTSPFLILRVSSAFFYFDFILNRNSCKQTV